MFSVSEKASEIIRELVKGKQERPSVRILLQGGGCAGYYLGIAMDESSPNDEVFERHGVNYAVEKDLLKEAQPIAVEYIESSRGNGFQVTSNLSMRSGCDSCSSC
jgi:iron-sulfur cluster assembly accessory protein